MNEPRALVRRALEGMKEHYNPYRSFFFPYNLLMFPLAALDAVWSRSASAIFSLVGGVPFPAARDGNTPAEPLVEANARDVDIGGVMLGGWSFGDKLVFPTSGHSPCSISMVWPEKKAVFTSDADWIGNPVFMDSSMDDSVASLRLIRQLAESGAVDLVLPAHGVPREGASRILVHLDSRINHLPAMRNEVLTYHLRHKNADILSLTRILVSESPLFKMLKQSNYPRSVTFPHNVVAICLRENGNPA